MKINIAASILQNLSVFWYADFYWKLAHGGAPVSAYFDSFFLPDSKGFNKILRENRVVNARSWLHILLIVLNITIIDSKIEIYIK